MKLRVLVLALIIGAAVAAWRGATAQQPAPAAVTEERTTAGGLNIYTTAFGHQYRQDDWPAIKE